MSQSADFGLLALGELVVLQVGGLRELEELRAQALRRVLRVEGLDGGLLAAGRVLAGAVDDGALGALRLVEGRAPWRRRLVAPVL